MLEIVILAAGKGTRMKSKLPKVLHPIAGKPMLAHVIDSARELQPERLHVVMGHGSEEVERRFTAEDVNFVLQEQQLGTAHAVAQALPQIQGESTCLVLYGDVPLTSVATLRALVDAVQPGSLGLLTVELDDPFGYGRILRDAGGEVEAIVEEKDATDEQRRIGEGNTGMLAVTASDLKRWIPEIGCDNAQGEYYLTDLIGMARRDGQRIAAIGAMDEFEVLGVNNRQQQAQLERYFQKRKADDLMTQGATLLDPSRFDCRGDISVGSDVVIDINCVFEGTVQLHDDVSIGANCILKDCSIGAGTVIKPNTIIEESQLGADCEVGPYARVRPGTELLEGARLGNFVETKKSVVGRGSKVNHLTYIGDTTIGEKVNVGAGTITCNYDGVNKWQTVIGDGAFIGSNTSIVAPVNIGAGATIAAGSTITNEVKERELAVSRARQRNLSNWKRPEKAG